MNVKRFSLERLNFLQLGLRSDDVEKQGIPGNKVCGLNLGQNTLEGKLV